MMNMVLVVLTLVGIDVALSCLKQRFPKAEQIIDGEPVVVFDEQGLHEEVLAKERVGREDILNAARRLQGIANFDEIQYAVLEQTGEITIVPKRH